MSASPLASPGLPRIYRPSLLGSLGRVALAGATFVLVGGLLRSVAAPAGGSVIGGKLEYWRDHGSRYDTLFVGSSHVYRAFVPDEFDRALAEHGLATRSFNFGVQAVQLLESRYLVRTLLAEHPEVERVFLEYQWLAPQIDPQNVFNARTVYWHDADTTRLAVERALHWGAELGERFRFVEDGARRHSLFTVLARVFPAGSRAAEEHLEHFLTERLLIGRGKDVLKGLIGRGHGQTGRFGTQHGYLSLEEEERQLAGQGEEPSSFAQRRQRFLASQEAYRRDVGALEAGPEAFGDGEWVNADLTRVDDFELVAGLAQEVRARGVEFVLVILPSQSCNRPFEERLLAELGSLVLRFNLPERFPALYEPAQRYDSGHLSSDGARLFTRLLAREYTSQRVREDDGQPAAGEVQQ